MQYSDLASLMEWLTGRYSILTGSVLTCHQIKNRLTSSCMSEGGVEDPIIPPSSIIII